MALLQVVPREADLILTTTAATMDLVPRLPTWNIRFFLTCLEHLFSTLQHRIYHYGLLLLHNNNNNHQQYLVNNNSIQYWILLVTPCCLTNNNLLRLLHRPLPLQHIILLLLWCNMAKVQSWRNKQVLLLRQGGYEDVISSSLQKWLMQVSRNLSVMLMDTITWSTMSDKSMFKKEWDCLYLSTPHLVWHGKTWWESVEH